MDVWMDGRTDRWEDVKKEEIGKICNEKGKKGNWAWM